MQTPISCQVLQKHFCCDVARLLARHCSSPAVEPRSLPPSNIITIFAFLFVLQTKLYSPTLFLLFDNSQTAKWGIFKNICVQQQRQGFTLHSQWKIHEQKWLCIENSERSIFQDLQEQMAKVSAKLPRNLEYDLIPCQCQEITNFTSTHIHEDTGTLRGNFSRVFIWYAGELKTRCSFSIFNIFYGC